MRKFLLLCVIVGVALGRPDDPEIAVRAPSTFQNCECQCDSYTWSSKGRVLGNCFSPDATGANFCYISGRAIKFCRDVQISESRADSFSNRGKFYSYEACATPPRNQCFGSGGPGSNFGDGDFGAGAYGGGGGFGGRPVGPPPVPIGSGPVGYGGGAAGRPPATNLASILGIRSGNTGGGDDAIKA